MAHQGTLPMDGTVIETQAPGAESSERQFVDPESATPEQLRDAMNNPDKFTFEKPEESGDPGSVTTDEKPDDNPGEQPPGTVKDPDEDEHSAPVKNRVKVRIAHLSEAERDVMLRVSKGSRLADAQASVVEDLVRGGKSLSEAEAEVYGKPGRKVASETTKPEVTKTETQKTETTDPVASLEGELATLKAKLAEARAAYKVDEIEEIRDQIEEKRWAIREAKESASRAAEEQQRETLTSRDRAVQAATAEATTLFPDAAVEGTELFEEIADAVEDLRETNPAFFDNPRWPVILAAEKAAILGIPSTKVKGGANPQPGEKQPAPAPRKATRPVVPASGTSGGGTTTQKTAEPADMEAELAAAGNDPEKLLSIVRKYGVKGSPTMSIADAFAVQP